MGVDPGVHVLPEVRRSLSEGAPVVALESALITHGLPTPSNLEVARRMEATAREEGCTPATIALLDDGVHIGLTDGELSRLAEAQGAHKVSLRDLPAALAQGWVGGATVAATMHLAHQAGIDVFATGGIGGVHRGAPQDVSADLTALATIPLVVVCAGAKVILDLPRTLEALETRGVAVVGYGTDRFPAFTSRSSGLPVSIRLDGVDGVAALVRARDALDLRAAVLVCVPIPAAAALPLDYSEAEIEAAVAEARAQGVLGKDLTPFLLTRLAQRTHGRSQEANEALLISNTRVAAGIAKALGRLRGRGSSVATNGNL